MVALLNVVQRAVALLDGALVLFRRQAENVLELLVHLPLEKVGLGEVDEGVQEEDALSCEQVAFLGERGLHGLGRGGHGGAGARLA